MTKPTYTAVFERQRGLLGGRAGRGAPCRHLRPHVGQGPAWAAAAEAANEASAAMTREAAEALVRTGHLSTRDAAELLGLSHQRVQQLIAVRS